MNPLSLLAASEPHNLGTDVINGIGELSNEGVWAPLRLANVLSAFVGLITVIIFIAFFFIILSGAIKIITSGDNKDSFEDGKKKITSGVIGLTIAIATLLLVDFIGTLFGIGNLLLDVGEIILRIQLRLLS